MYKILRTTTILLLLCLFTLSSYAQDGKKIYGIIKDNVNEPLIGASVSLKNNLDSFVAGAAADIDGNFVLTYIPNGSYKMQISYLGYENYNKVVDMQGSEINLGIIKLSPTKGTTLNEVKIVEKAPPVLQKDDTTQFNAGSYKVNPDATAEDLIRKMPGVDLSTGKAQVQGEDVKKVLVDGKPFFGDDPTSSLKNLPAEVIDKIQVYDEKSDQSQFTGFDDGNTSKTINIITKPGKKEGTFGKLYAGGGADGSKDDAGDYTGRYNAGGNINYFSGDRRISLIGQTNNVNIQNFSSQDLVGVSGSSGGRGGGRSGGGGGSSSDNFLTGQQGGISKTNAVGFNYSDKWGKKIDVTASYFFNNSANTTKQTSQRIYSLAENEGQTYFDTSIANTTNTNHRFNMRFNYTIDSNNSLLIVPSLSFQNNDNKSVLSALTLQGANIANQTINDYASDKAGNNLSTMLLFRHKFAKQGRTLSLWANGTYNKNDGNSNLYALIQTTDGIDTTNQEGDNKQHGWNINSNINYTEPLSKKSFLQIQYGLNYQQSSSDKLTNDYSYVTNDYTDLNTLLSNRFTTNYITNKGGLSYRFNDTKFSFNAGVDFQNANLDNKRELPYNNAIERSFNSLLPNARFQYNWNKKKSLRIFYRTSTSAPSVNQLQDVVDNSNPLQISTGNPDLVQTYDQRLFLRYNSTNTNVGSTFFGMLSGQTTQNYIANSTIVAQDSTTINGTLVPKGGQYTRPENMSGYVNTRAFATYGLPLSALKSNLNTNASLSYTRTPGMINLEKNYANNTAMGLGVVLSSNISEKIDFTLSTNGNYNIVRNTLNTNANTNYYSQSSRLSLNVIFWKGIVFNSELNHQLYRGLSAAYNQNYFLWNMSVAKKLFKKQQAEIKLSVYDLLKQNNSIGTNISPSYTEYTQTNVLQRYFMLTFTYNLRFFKGGASMKDAENSNGEGPDFRRGGFGGPPPGGAPPGGPGGGSMPPPMD